MFDKDELRRQRQEELERLIEEKRRQQEEFKKGIDESSGNFWERREKPDPLAGRPVDERPTFTDDDE